MSAPSAQPNRPHRVGLAFAMALVGVSILAARLATWLLRGSIFEDLGWLATFGAIVAVLAIGQAFWPRIARRLDPVSREK